MLVRCTVVEEVYKPEKVVPPEMSGPGDVDEPAPGEFEPENEDNGDDDEDYRNNINQMPGMPISPVNFLHLFDCTQTRYLIIVC